VAHLLQIVADEERNLLIQSFCGDWNTYTGKIIPHMHYYLPGNGWKPFVVHREGWRNVIKIQLLG
jgi:hypothetical protein